MKINLNNTDLINGTLMRINGKAKEHVFNDALDLRHAARQMRHGLNNILTKKQQKGAILVIYSSDKVESSYKYKRLINECRILIGSKHMFLVGCERYDVSPQGRIKNDIELTPDQMQTAITRFKNKYSLFMQINDQTGEKRWI